MPLTRIKNTAIGDGGISTAKLADGAVTTVKVADSAVNSAKIGVDVIVADDLAANSVTVSEITDGAVTGAKLADNLNYDSGTLYLDSTNNRVGIGETSPLGKLHIKEGDSGVTSVSTDADQLVIENNAESGISLLAPSNSASRIAFGDGDNNKIGQIYYNHTNNFMKFDINNVERVRIESGGHLMVGTTDTNPANNGGAGNPGIAISPDGVIRAARTGNVSLDINRMGSDGEIAAFRKDGNTRGQIGTEGTWGSGLQILGSNSRGFIIVNPNTNVNEIIPNVDTIGKLGNSSNRWSDLYLSGGVYLGGTAAANHLDDYEEGEWTPIVYGSTSGTATGSSGAGSGGSYVKIGNYVWLSFYFANPSISGTMSGDLYLGPLPFTQDNNDRFDNGAGGEIMTHRYFNSGSSTRKITMKISRGESRALFRKQDFGSNNEDSPLNQSTAGVITSTLIWGHLRMRVT